MDNTLKIINYLGKHIDRSFTMHELSKATKIPYATFHRTISQIKDLVKIQEIGRSKVIIINKDNASIKPYLTISSEEEKKEYLKKQPIINKIVSELDTKDIVLLFGSYAKGSQKDTSDIDLLIINPTGKKSISLSKYEVLFNKKINPIFVTKQEFKKMLHDKEENVGKQALVNHIILNNSEKFWVCVIYG